MQRAALEPGGEAGEGPQGLRRQVREPTLVRAPPNLRPGLADFLVQDLRECCGMCAGSWCMSGSWRSASYGSAIRTTSRTCAAPTSVPPAFAAQGTRGSFDPDSFCCAGCAGARVHRYQRPDPEHSGVPTPLLPRGLLLLPRHAHVPRAPGRDRRGTAQIGRSFAELKKKLRRLP